LTLLDWGPKFGGALDPMVFFSFLPNWVLPSAKSIYAPWLIGGLLRAKEIRAGPQICRRCYCFPASHPAARCCCAQPRRPRRRNAPAAPPPTPPRPTSDILVPSPPDMIISICRSRRSPGGRNLGINFRGNALKSGVHNGFFTARAPAQTIGVFFFGGALPRSDGKRLRIFFFRTWGRG